MTFVHKAVRKFQILEKPDENDVLDESTATKIKQKEK